MPTPMRQPSPRAGWDAHGPYAVVQSRNQRTVRFLSIDPATCETFILNEQWDQCLVQLIPGLPARSQAPRRAPAFALALARSGDW